MKPMTFRECRTCLVGLLLLCALVQALQGSTSQTARREAFVAAVRERLREADVPKEKLRAIDAAYESWVTAGRPEDRWAEVSDAIAAAAFRKNVSSHVTVATDPKPGATIKYQLVGERRRGEEPHVMGTSEAKKDLTVGDYHIWAERGSKATTSVTDWYEIVEPTRTIKLVEGNAKNDKRNSKQ